MLSQQTLFELLVAGFVDTGEIFDDHGGPADISTWRGVYLENDENGNDTVDIDWSYMWLSGTLDLQWLPHHSSGLKIKGNQLSDSVNFEALLDGLKYLNLGMNTFVGTVNLTKLPSSLEMLSLRDNQFEGTVDLTQLPGKMHHLYLDDNGFFGYTDFGRIPASMAHLYISNTLLPGVISKDQTFNIVFTDTKVVDEQ